MSIIIPESVIVNFKSASDEEKKEVIKIFMEHYKQLMDEMLREANYVCTTSYWTNHTPLSGKRISAQKFIKMYKNKT